MLVSCERERLRDMRPILPPNQLTLSSLKSEDLEKIILCNSGLFVTYGKPSQMTAGPND